MRSMNLPIAAIPVLWRTASFGALLRTFGVCFGEL